MSGGSLSQVEEELLEEARSSSDTTAVNAALIEVLFRQHHHVSAKLDRLTWAVITALAAALWDLLQAAVL